MMASALQYFQLQIIGKFFHWFVSIVENDFFFVVFFSDTMGNKGAFITLNGKDMKPEYTTYEAVVSSRFSFFYLDNTTLLEFLKLNFLILILSLQPHPNVKPMEYASSLMNMIM